MSTSRVEKLSGLLRVLVPETNLQAVAICAATGDPTLFDALLEGVRVLRPKDNVPRLSPRQREVLAIGASVPELHPNALFEGAHSDIWIRMPALCALLGAAPSARADQLLAAARAGSPFDAFAGLVATGSRISPVSGSKAG